MTTPDLSDIMPRSWVLESSGSGWEWLSVVAGESTPSNARSMPLPNGGGWMITVSSALTVDSSLRLDDGEGNLVLAIIPATTADGPFIVKSIQAPVKKAGAIHIQTRGPNVAGKRVLVTAIPVPLYQP